MRPPPDAKPKGRAKPKKAVATGSRGDSGTGLDKPKPAPKAPAYKPRAGSADHGATPASPVRVVAHTTTGKAKVVVEPNVASAQARLDRAQVAHDARKKSREADAYANELRGHARKTGPKQETRAIQAGRQAAKAIAPGQARDIKLAGVARKPGYKQQERQFAQGIKREATRIDKRIGHEGDTQLHGALVDAHQRGHDIRTPIHQELDRRKAAKDAEHAKASSAADVIGNAKRELRDTVTGIPATVRELTNVGAEQAKVAAGVAKHGVGRRRPKVASPHTEAFVRGLNEQTVPGRLAHGDVKGAARLAVTRPIGTTLTLATGVGAVARGVQEAVSVGKAVKRGSRTVQDVRASVHEQRARRAVRPAAKVTRPDGVEIAREHRTYSQQPVRRAGQKVRDKSAPGGELKGRARKRAVTRAAKQQVGKQQAAGHVREHEVEAAVTDATARERGYKAAKTRRHVARQEHRVLRGRGEEAQLRRHAVAELQSGHVHPDELHGTLDARIAATRKALATATKDEAPAVQANLGRLEKMRDRLGKRHSPLEDPEVRAVAARRREVSVGQTRRRKARGLVDEQAQGRVALGVAVARGEVTHVREGGKLPGGGGVPRTPVGGERAGGTPRGRAYADVEAERKSLEASHDALLRERQVIVDRGKRAGAANDELARTRKALHGEGTKEARARAKLDPAQRRALATEFDQKAREIYGKPDVARTGDALSRRVHDVEVEIRRRERGGAKVEGPADLIHMDGLALRRYHAALSGKRAAERVGQEQVGKAQRTLQGTARRVESLRGRGQAAAEAGRVEDLRQAYRDNQAARQSIKAKLAKLPAKRQPSADERVLAKLDHEIRQAAGDGAMHGESSNVSGLLKQRQGMVDEIRASRGQNDRITPETPVEAPKGHRARYTGFYNDRGEKVSAHDLPHEGGYVPTSRELEGQIDPRLAASDLKGHFTGQGIHSEDWGKYDPRDTQGRLERGTSAQALKRELLSVAVDARRDMSQSEAGALARETGRKTGVPHRVVETPTGHAVLPKAHAQAWMAASRDAGLVGKALHAANRRFVRAVLPLSAPWHTANAADMMTRLALSGARPGDAHLRDVLRGHLADHNEDWAREAIDAFGGAHFRAQSTSQVAHQVPLLDNAIDHAFAAGRAVEAQAAKSAQGLAARQQARELGVHGDIAKQLVEHWQQRPELVADFNKKTLEIVGDYVHQPTLFGRDVRAISPFVQWIKASLKFTFKTLPAKHPVRTALLFNLAAATEEERRQIGASQYITNEQADKLGLPRPNTGYLAGAVGVGPGVIATTPLTSMGAAGGLIEDPIDYADRLALPFINRPLGHALGYRGGAIEYGLRSALGQSMQGRKAGHPGEGPTVRDAANDVGTSFLPGASDLERTLRRGRRPGPHTNPLDPAEGTTGRSYSPALAYLGTTPQKPFTSDSRMPQTADRGRYTEVKDLDGNVYLMDNYRGGSVDGSIDQQGAVHLRATPPAPTTRTRGRATPAKPAAPPARGRARARKPR